MSLKAIKTYKTEFMIPNQIFMIDYFYFLLHLLNIFYYKRERTVSCPYHIHPITINWSMGNFEDCILYKILCKGELEKRR